MQRAQGRKNSTEGSTSDILRFDLCPDKKEGDSNKNTDSLPGSSINTYPPPILKNVTSHDPQTNVDDVLEALTKLESLRDRKIHIFTCDDVEIYFITPNGDARSTFEKNKLIIFKLDGDPAEINFLEVGDWVYPLFSVVKPCYKREEGIFVFPDIHSNVKNATVGLVLPRANCDALYEVLSDILDDEEPSRTRRSTAPDAPSPILQNLTSGTSYLAGNLIRASTSLASGMDSATSSLLKNIQPQGYKSVDPSVKCVAHVASAVTARVADTTGFIASTLGNAVIALGRYISPHVSKKLQEKVPPDAIDVTLSALQGIGNIYTGLEESAGILAHSISNNAVKLVEHRYGQPAGQVTSDVLSTVRNIYIARRNAGLLKPKSLAKGIVRSAGNAMIEDMKQSQSFQGLKGRAGPDPFDNP